MSESTIASDRESLTLPLTSLPLHSPSSNIKMLGRASSRWQWRQCTAVTPPAPAPPPLRTMPSPPRLARPCRRQRMVC
jgi:hypothetical protein